MQQKICPARVHEENILYPETFCDILIKGGILMWKKQLCMNVSERFGLPLERQLELLKQVGFDGYFPTRKRELDLAALVGKARALGLLLQSIHAPWGKMADIWQEDEEKGTIAVEELKTCLTDCDRYGAPLLVVHGIIGMDAHTPTEIGLERFSSVVDYARTLGVQVAFENVEGDEYLHALMEHFAGDSTVGFCWDTGHEMCYNHSQDQMAQYGDRLLCTHLNDNLGISDFSGKIAVRDDLHLLPFDGIADWENIVDRLHKWGYQGPLTFELVKFSKPDRHENDGYAAMSLEQFFTLAYQRACKVAAMLVRLEAK